jgi:hypothetical protein
MAPNRVGQPTRDPEQDVAPGRRREPLAAYRDIGLATDLRTLERLNARPFVLAGFDWDYEGTVLYWQGGELAPTATERCRLIVRLEPSPGAPRDLVDQVVGDRDFPSDHPAMRALNPLVYPIILELP